eukprot:470801_1
MCMRQQLPCCRCIWKRCSICAQHLTVLRIVLILFCITDMIVMLWYLYAIGASSEEIKNCCSVSSNYAQPSINSTSLKVNYSTCSDLNYFDDVIESYCDTISPFNKHFLTNIKHYNMNKFSSLFTSYNTKITVGNNGGCIYNSNINCLSDTVMPCVEYFNKTEAKSINNELSSICYDNISDKEVSYISSAILIIVTLKILVIFTGICFKIYHKELNPQNKHQHFKRLSMPSFGKMYKQFKDQQTERIEREPNENKSQDVDVYHAMNHPNSDTNICGKLYHAVEYIYVFFHWLCVMIKWIIGPSLWIILLIISLLCSMRLFTMYHSPILGIDNEDFCTDLQMKESSLISKTCHIAENECGVVNWIVLPDVHQYVFPRYCTMIVALLAVLIRCVERCAACQQQELKNIAKTQNLVLNDTNPLIQQDMYTKIISSANVIIEENKEYDDKINNESSQATVSFVEEKSKEKIKECKENMNQMEQKDANVEKKPVTVIHKEKNIYPISVQDLGIASKCEIYSDSRQEWFIGEVIDISYDEQGEWLKVKYADNSVKLIQRYNKSLRIFKHTLKQQDVNNIFDKWLKTFEMQIRYQVPFDHTTFQEMFESHDSYPDLCIKLKYDNYKTLLHEKDYHVVLKSFIAWSLTLGCEYPRCSTKSKLSCYCDINEYQLFAYTLIIQLLKCKSNHNDSILNALRDSSKTPQTIANHICKILPADLQNNSYFIAFQTSIISW